MNEKRIDGALRALSGQKPKTPASLLESMIKKAQQLEKERKDGTSGHPPDDCSDDDEPET
ncbi:MAG: hypothetical protein J6X85_05565 [Ruminococcus sp.]|nr:hypothetical protein [Ruminococcus sp.]MBP5581240.1 hypothetical protein [Ruminococcus sp.]